MVNEELLYKIIGGKLKRIRLSMDPPMTQTALGDRVDLTRASVAQIEAGRQKAPLHTLYNLFLLLGVEEPREMLPTAAEATSPQTFKRMIVDGEEVDVPPKSAKFIQAHIRSKKR